MIDTLRPPSPPPAASTAAALAARDELPYDAVSVSGCARGLEWRVPLWDAINAMQPGVKGAVREGLVVRVEEAVKLAMRIALECSSFTAARGGTGQPTFGDAVMPRVLCDKTYILRRAARDYPCQGDGARAPRHHAQCEGIVKGDRYVEYVREVPAYQVGDRVCVVCALYLHGVGERAG